MKDHTTSEVNLLETADAVVWANEFVRLNPGADHGLMLSWFANSIMVGFDEASRRKEKEVSYLRAALNQLTYADTLDSQIARDALNGTWEEV